MSPHKLTSWALLVIVSMMLVVQLKRVKGARTDHPHDVIVEQRAFAWPRRPKRTGSPTLVTARERQ